MSKMWFGNKIFILFILECALLHCILHCQARFPHQRFVVREAKYTRLCKTKKILTVNGQFPGPTIYVRKGDTVVIDVYNEGNYNITLHWHGVNQPRYPWSDGPEYITQCPIKPSAKFSQQIIFSTEEGTLWWHAHSEWSRATVHGAIVVLPKHDTHYPFPKPHAEVPIILGEWWKEDVMKVLSEALQTGAQPNTSDAFTINGHPGDLYPCSKSGTFKLKVKRGKTYLLRIINASLNHILFFSIANHNLTVVGGDASYTKPFTTDIITISPGQTYDALLHANQLPDRYYMAARAYSSGIGVAFDHTTTTAIIHYHGAHRSPPQPPHLPDLPCYNDTLAFFDFSSRIRSLASETYPISVPINVTTKLITTLSVNTFPCPVEGSCGGPNGTRFAASMNNISFVIPTIDILEAYYYHVKGVFGDLFPDFPPLGFDFTADYIPLDLLTPKRGTEVKVLEYGSTVEVVLQGTNLVAGLDHPMHLHGHNIYVVGAGFGNFDKDKDPLTYNLVDPPLRNTAAVPKNGWIAIRFLAKNPGVWLMHCHLERHVTWGMEMAFLVKNGGHMKETLLPPPLDMPPC